MIDRFLKHVRYIRIISHIPLLRTRPMTTQTQPHHGPSAPAPRGSPRGPDRLAKTLDRHRGGAQGERGVPCGSLRPQYGDRITGPSSGPGSAGAPSAGLSPAGADADSLVTYIRERAEGTVIGGRHHRPAKPNSLNVACAAISKAYGSPDLPTSPSTRGSERPSGLTGTEWHARASG